jgi:hypothetical protein
MSTALASLARVVTFRSGSFKAGSLLDKGRARPADTQI